MNNEDVSARIVIAIETANALEQCQTLEEALTRITEARERDNSVAKTGVQVDNAASVANIEEETSAIEKRTEARKADNTEKKTSEGSAPDNSATISAIQAETQAIKERTEARKAEASQTASERKQSFAEIHGMSEEEYERMARANREASERARAEQDRLWQEQKNRQNQAQSEEPIDPKREAAIDALHERKNILRELGLAHEAYSAKTKTEIEEEIAGQKKIIAHLKKRIALRKKLELEYKLDSAKADLSMPDVKKDPEKLLSALNLRDKLQNQLVGAEMEVLNAENAIKNLDGLSDSAKKTTGAMNSFARTMIKSIRNIAQVGGRSLGVDVSAEGLQAGGAAGKLAAVGMTVGALSALMRSAINVYSQNMADEIKAREDSYQSLVKATRREKEAMLERENGLRTLREFSQKDELNDNERFRQAEILKKLNYSLENMQVEIDSTTGKIKNLAAVEWQVKKRDAQRLLEFYDTQRKAAQAEIDAANEVSKPKVITELIDSFSWLSPLAKGVFLKSPETRDLLANTVNDMWDSTLGSAPARQNDERRRRAQDAYDDANKNYHKIKATISDDAEIAYLKNINTQMSSEINKIKKISSLRFKTAVDYAGNLGKERKISLSEDLTALRDIQEKLSTAEKAVDAAKKNLDEKETVENIRAYNKALVPFLDLMKKKEEIEKRNEERRLFNLSVSRELKDMFRRITYQNMINAGLSKEAELLQIANEAENKVVRQGWSVQDAKQWAKYRAMMADQQGQIKINGLVQNAWQIRDTSTAAIMSNSMEAMRMQSRQLVQNTPQQKILTVSQKQFSVVSAIEKKLRNWDPTGIREYTGVEV